MYLQLLYVCIFLFTDEHIIAKVLGLLNSWESNLKENAIVVTSGRSDMQSTYHNYDHIFCVDYLIHNAVQKSMTEVTDADILCRACAKVVKYFMQPDINSKLTASLSGFCSTGQNTIYTLLAFIEKNWEEIVGILREKNELSRISKINLNQIRGITKLVEPFDETLKILQDESHVTLHLVIVSIHDLKKKCAPNSQDLEIVKDLKEKLSTNLDIILTNNLTIFHKIALFLFPPANKLIQFNRNEKQLIKNQCKRIMKTYNTEVAAAIEPEIQNAMPTISTNSKYKMFSDFVLPPEKIRYVDKIADEIERYERINESLSDDFNILQWWDHHKNEFPLLYKTSCKILATPASISSSKRALCSARNLISNEKCGIDSNDISINQIMFIHSNIRKSEQQSDLTK